MPEQANFKFKRPPISDISTALEIYWNYPEIGVEQVKRLFGFTSKAAAHKYKSEVRAAMAEEKIPQFSYATVNTRFAFKHWGIDVEDLEKRAAKIRRMERSI